MDYSSSSSFLIGSDGVEDRVPNVLHCHLCRLPPRSPVATSCGHMCCWPCLYRSLRGRPQPCPVCRTRFRIVPIYGVHAEDGAGDGAGDGIPPRPGNSPTPVSAPSPTLSETRRAFAVLEMVNGRLQREKWHARQANMYRLKILLSVLRELRTLVGDGDDMSLEQDVNSVRTLLTREFAALKRIREQLIGLRDERRRFERLKNLVTRAGGNWWDQGTGVVELIASTGANYATGLIFHGELNSQF